MPDPQKPHLPPQTDPRPDNPDSKPQTKPVGRDPDATPGKGTEPARTPSRAGPQNETAERGPDWNGEVPAVQPELGGADPDPFKIA